jgi:ferredoxin-NADP reductase
MATEAVVIAGQMAGQTSKLMRREEVVEDTIAFHFEKPSGFNFKAGQFADVTLTDPPETDAEGNTRTFSIASPLFENELVFTTRMRDTAFKHSLKKVPLATEVKIGSAAGSFTLHKNRAKPAVFLAGGIGITFLSIVRQADGDRLPQKIHLFYSNRRPEDAAFLDTLQTLETTNPHFRLICTMTEMSKSTKEWKSETALRQGHAVQAFAHPAWTHLLRCRASRHGGGYAADACWRWIEEDDIRAEEFAGY